MCEPSVNAAALAKTRVPPPATVSRSTPGSAVSRHARSAYVGLPGPAKTQHAARTAVRARSRASPSISALRQPAALT
ncbi:MAG: hypothetical protein WKF51_02060 [Geodermatophilaceae bacterium]